MLKVILEIDKKIFKFINGELSHAWLDPLMVLVSQNYFYIVLSLLLVVWAIIKKRPQIFLIIVAALIVGSLVDLITFEVLKPFFGRFRPCQHSPQFVRVLDGCAGRLSFPSNHSTNAAAVAVVFTVLGDRRWGVLLACLASVIGFSRIYVGAHYPGDVLGGFVFGALLASALLYCLMPLIQILNPYILLFSAAWSKTKSTDQRQG